jgi:hypothetical protein
MAELSKEITVWIHVLRTDKGGNVLPKLNVEVSRVPAVGECIGWHDADDGDESKAPTYRVTHVLHTPRDKDTTDALAEVWAVEDESWAHLTPKPGS